METRYRILIVGNDPRICRLIQRYLEQGGYQSETAFSYREMLRKLTEVKIDLILLDALLPDGDGFSLSKELRSLPNVPIIIVTDNWDAHDRLLGLELSADDYVKKPLNNRELLRKILRALRRGSPNVLESD